MIKLVIVRHAQSQAGAQGIINDNHVPEKLPNHLSPKGLIEAQDLVERLKNYRFDEVIISELARTLETVEPYLKQKKKRPLVIGLTNERDSGIFSTKPKDAIKDYISKNKIEGPLSFRPQNGESIIDVSERAKNFITYLKRNHEGKTILLCGHATFLTCLMIALENKNIKDYEINKNIKTVEIREFEI